MKFKWLVLLVTIIYLMNVPSFAEDDLKDILLLNSYHDGYQWSDDTRQGIKDALGEDVINYHMRVEHMDTKNISTDEYMEELLSLYKIKYDKDEFDVIVSGDDNALKFLLRYREELFGDTPIFFCGVNTLSAHDLEDQEMLFGVVEKHSIAPTVSIAKMHNPNLKNVYLLVDNSITGKSTKIDAISDMEKNHPDINFVVLEDMLYKDMLNKVSTLNIEDTIVIQSFFVVDYDGKTFPLDYSARQLVKYSSVPVYGVFTFAFGEGTVGGKFVEGYTQGKRVGTMVADYLFDGSIPEESYIVDDSYNRYMFDYDVMKKHNLSMDVLPDQAIIINEPVTFYDRHSRVINISLLVVAFLTAYVLLLRRQIGKQTERIMHTQKSLMESEKMAALGRLVAGLAHEINTPIGIGVTLASHIEVETEAVHKAYKEETLSRTELEGFLKEQKSAADLLGKTMSKASDLVQSFKRVAVDQSVDEEKEFEVCEYIQEIINSLKTELKRKSITVVLEFKEEIFIVGYASALYQIILNLVMNSLIHGFDDKDNGEIKIKVEKLETEDSKVRITYHDNGKGISKEHIDKIYEPFYTTKRTEGGTGLGLAIIYNIVDQRLDGNIFCESDGINGTTFIIEIPVKYKE